MSEKPMHVAFILDRWNGGVQRLSHEAEYVYFKLCAEMWGTGEPVSRDEALAVCRFFPQTDAAIDELVKAEKLFLEDGKLWNDRALKEHGEAQEKREKYSKAGKAAMAKRWHRDNDVTNDAKSDAGNTLDNTQTQTPTHKPTSAPARDAGASSPDLSDPKTQLYHRGKQVLGSHAGGVITGLLKRFEGSVAKARAAIETASDKADPGEYINAIIRKRDPPKRPVRKSAI